MNSTNNQQLILPKTRQLDPFYKRINDIEKKAKALDQEIEESMDQLDINEFFNDPKTNTIQQQQDMSILSKATTQNLNFTLLATEQRNQSFDSRQQQSIIGSGPGLPSIPDDFENQIDFKFLSQLLQNLQDRTDQTEIQVSKQDMTKTIEDINGQVFIAPYAQIRDELCDFYGISKKQDKENKNNYQRGMVLFKSNQIKAAADDQFERLDSRGKRIKIRRVHAHQEVLGEIGYPYSTINFHPFTYITQHELKARANSLAYAQYKLIKREQARKAAKRKLLLVMTVVKCKAFINKLKLKVQQRKDMIRKQEEEAKQKEMRRKRLKDVMRMAQPSQNMTSDGGGDLDSSAMLSSRVEMSGLVNQLNQNTIGGLLGNDSDQSSFMKYNTSANFGPLKVNETNMGQPSPRPVGNSRLTPPPVQNMSVQQQFRGSISASGLMSQQSLRTNSSNNPHNNYSQYSNQGQEIFSPNFMRPNTQISNVATHNIRTSTNTMNTIASQKSFVGIDATENGTSSQKIIKVERFND